MTDLISRTAVIAELNKIGLAYGVTGIPATIVRAKSAVSNLPPAEGSTADLIRALEMFVALVQHINTSEGVCCCGDFMDTHANPMDCGHAPCDIGDYFASQALDEARKVLATVGVDPK